MNAKTITAKFESKCTACGNVIPEGSRCLWTPGVKGAKHVSCPAESFSDVTFTIKGAELMARWEALKARVAELHAVAEDWVKENTSVEPPGHCSCGGRGVQVMRVNVSDTLDYSDFRHYQYRCGTAVEMEWPKDRYALPRLVAATPGEELVHDDYTDHPKGTTPRNEECIERSKRYNAWLAEREEAWRTTRILFPELYAVTDLMRLASNDLNVRRGDVAIVINRGKERTGRVVYVGPDSYSGRQRVKVVDADGKQWGGDPDEAELVERVVQFPRLPGKGA